MPDSFAEILEKGFEHCRDMDAPLSARLEAFADIVRSLARRLPRQWIGSCSGSKTMELEATRRTSVIQCHRFSCRANRGA